MKKTDKSDMLEPVNIHIRGINVATCEECNERGIEANRKFRVIIKNEPVFCPDCEHALYYERKAA